MQRVRAGIGLTVGLFLACRSATTTGAGDCGEAPLPSVPPHQTVSRGHIIDTGFARSDLARLVFRVRSAGPTEPGKILTTPFVALRDSLAADRAQLGRIGDSTGLAVVDSVPLRYTAAQVRRIGYVTRTFPIAVRGGYTDTIDVTLAEARLCLYHSRSAFAKRLQN